MRAEDLVQSMEKMSQSNRSPLELDSPIINVKITYVKPPTGSGTTPSISDEFVLPPKKNCGRKRKFDTGKLLELITAEKRKRATEEEEGRANNGAHFLDDEAAGGSEEEEEFECDSENGDIEEVLIGREETKMKSSPAHARSANKMKNNGKLYRSNIETKCLFSVSKDCLPHALHQAFCYWRYKENPTKTNRYLYSSSLRKNGSNPEVHKQVFEEVEKMKKEAGFVGKNNKEENFGWRDIDQFQKTVFAGIFQIICFEQNSTLPFYRGEDFLGEKNILYIYLENGHYQGIRSVTSLLKTKYYCPLCDVRSRDATSHYKCKLIHYTCGKKCPVTPEDIPMDCKTCRVTFRSEGCYQNHLEKGSKGGKSRCAYTKFCDKCEKAYYQNKNSKPHVCGESYCHRCQMLKAGEHHCAMTVSKKNEKNLTWKRIYYDIESKVDEETGRQVPVLFMALRCCPKCVNVVPKEYENGVLDICEDCSPEGRAKMIECVSEDNREVDVSSSMVNWMFDAENKGFVCVAHNSSGYDGQFILENLIASNKAAPVVCLDGTKLIYLRHKGVKLVDSMKYLTMSLSGLGKTFEVDSLKGDFPVCFIRPENYDYIGKLPDDKEYALENKSADVKAKLQKFLAEERSSGKQFNFFEELKKYCYNDVYMLAASMASFEKEFETITDVCLLEESVTIAAAAVKTFRRKHLQNLCPIVLDPKPSASYNASIKSQKYLLWLAHKEEVAIEISTTSGEKKFGPYRVDGFIDKCPKYPDRLILEFNGCYYHAHDCRFTAESIIGDRMAKDIWERDNERIKKLEEFHPVRVIRECDVDRELKEVPGMAEFFENNEAKELLQLQRALVGGRTEVFKLCENNQKKTIRFVDVVSLYPTVMKHYLYPIGIPTNVPPSKIKVPITNPDDLPFRGFLHCKILALQDLLLPVIGDKSSGKLVFGLCRKCSMTQNQGECWHSVEERAFTGVYCTPELHRAISRGYIITEVYHGIEYENWLGNDEEGKGGLFTSYVNDNMCEKIYASGFPADVKTDAEQKEFIREYEEKEQIKLDQSKFAKKPGKRAVAKLMLNSLWGKFAQRVDRLQNEIIMDPLKFYRILHDTALEVLDVRPVNDTLIVQYRTREESLMSLRTSACHIAALTTAYGRLELHELMEKAGAENLIYSDTDSIIYSVPEGEKNPLEGDMGGHLGQLTSELRGEMLNFVSTGPKSYSYIEKMEDGSLATKVKAKGITLNCQADKLITFEKMTQMVEEVLGGVGQRTVQEVPQFKMERNRDHHVFSGNRDGGFCLYRSENIKNYKDSLNENGMNPSVYQHIFEAVDKMKEESGITKSKNFDWYDVERFQNTVFAGLYQILGKCQGGEEGERNHPQLGC
ncbi:unnamed protein product [Caenorhabditis brenneri]